ncbi:MAG: terpene cyclase/mutase family protein [Deltaproteobacteria bacterium]|nr:terpene cyclase/mutase family protein [Deltaproteobacteria bacterium]
MSLEYLNQAINFLIRASSFIESTQLEDGSWTFGQKQKGDCYITAQGIIALCNTRSPDTLNLIKAAEFLKNSRNADFGWGRDPSPTVSDVQTTSLCCIAIKKISETTDAVSKGIEWLLNNQNEDGSFKDLIAPSGSLKATTHALLALGYFQAHTPVESINKAINWLKDTQTVDGGWGAIPGMADTAACTASVLEVVTEHNWCDFLTDGCYLKAKNQIQKLKTKKGYILDQHHKYNVEATSLSAIGLLNNGLSPTERVVLEPFRWTIGSQRENGSLPEQAGATGVEDICASADSINFVSKWLHRYIELHPYILIGNLEYLSSLEFNFDADKKDRELIPVGEERTKKSIINLKFFRHEWGKTSKFEKK